MVKRDCNSCRSSFRRKTKDPFLCFQYYKLWESHGFLSLFRTYINLLIKVSRQWERPFADISVGTLFWKTNALNRSKCSTFCSVFINKNYAVEEHWENAEFWQGREDFQWNVHIICTNPFRSWEKPVPPVCHQDILEAVKWCCDRIKKARKRWRAAPNNGLSSDRDMWKDSHNLQPCLVKERWNADAVE